MNHHFRISLQRKFFNLFSNFILPFELNNINFVLRCTLDILLILCDFFTSTFYNFRISNFRYYYLNILFFKEIALYAPIKLQATPLYIAYPFILNYLDFFSVLSTPMNKVFSLLFLAFLVRVFLY